MCPLSGPLNAAGWTNQPPKHGRNQTTYCVILLVQTSDRAGPRQRRPPPWRGTDATGHQGASWDDGGTAVVLTPADIHQVDPSVHSETAASATHTHTHTTHIHTGTYTTHTYAHTTHTYIYNTHTHTYTYNTHTYIYNTHIHTCTHTTPTPVLLPGKSHGWRSPVGCSPWGREESDTTEAT